MALDQKLHNKSDEAMQYMLALMEDLEKACPPFERLNKRGRLTGTVTCADVGNRERKRYQGMMSSQMIWPLKHTLKILR